MKFPPFREGYCFRSSACPGAVFRSLCQHEAEGIGCCMLEYSSSYSRVESNITMKMFKDIFGDTTRSQALFFDFLRSLADSRVSSCHQQSAYIAQVLCTEGKLECLNLLYTALILASLNLCLLLVRKQSEFKFCPSPSSRGRFSDTDLCIGQFPCIFSDFEVTSRSLGLIFPFLSHYS